MKRHSPETIAEVKALFDAGLSQKQIATRLGMSKGATNGICSRNGWVRPQSFQERSLAQKRRINSFHDMRRGGDKAKPRFFESEPPEGSVATAFTKGCRWIYGTPGLESHWCGKEIEKRSYCGEHYKRVYTGIMWP